MHASRALPQLSAPGLNLVAAADFDFNGTADLLFQNQTTGEVVVWYMNRTVFTSSATLATVPDPGWQLVAAADYNSDGRPDVFAFVGERVATVVAMAFDVPWINLSRRGGQSEVHREGSSPAAASLGACGKKKPPVA